MLLNEIISTDKVVKTKAPLSISKIEKTLGEKIGAGAFADVYKGRKPGTVIKLARTVRGDDPYVEFVRTALQNQDNPFFPRIYNAKLYDRGWFIVEMEKLVSLRDDKISETIQHILRNQLGINVDENDTVFSFALRAALDSSYARAKLREKTSNPQFVEALDAIDELFAKEVGGPDFHGGNIMVRLTGHGPQLVITDPIA